MNARFRRRHSYRGLRFKAARFFVVQINAFCFSSSSSFGGGGGINFTPATISSSSMFTTFLIVSFLLYPPLVLYIARPRTRPLRLFQQPPTSTARRTLPIDLQILLEQERRGYHVRDDLRVSHAAVSFPINWARIFTFGPAFARTDKTRFS